MQAFVIEHRHDETGHYMRVAFTRDGELVEKHVRLSGTRQDNGRTLAVRAREADRDIAHKLHGDAWREHCEYTAPFWDGLTLDQFSQLLESLETERTCPKCGEDVTYWTSACAEPGCPVGEGRGRG